MWLNSKKAPNKVRRLLKKLLRLYHRREIKSMPKAEITYKPVGINEKATHGDYTHLCQMWEGLTVGTAKVWATEMREHPDFKQFIDNPTHKIVFINYEGFRLFVKWKSRNRYRTKKETLAEMLENLKKEKQLGVLT
jgi:hypothetical protein